MNDTNLDEQINRIYAKIADAEDDWFNDRTINPRQIAIDEIKALIANQVREARIDELKRFDRSSEEMTKLIPLKIGERLYELTKQEEQL